MTDDEWEKSVQKSIEEARADISPPDPTYCPHANSIDHDSSLCFQCGRKRAVVNKIGREFAETYGLADHNMWVQGGELFDLPPVAPIWGYSDTPISAEEQGWMICAPDGVGKTSIACQYVRARLGLAGWEDFMWNMPVKPIVREERVLYMAMDRPRQIMEAFTRGLTEEEHFDILQERLWLHKGPPPFPLGRPQGTEWMLEAVEESNVRLVVFDSRKDMGNTLDAPDVTGVSRCVQSLTARGVEVLILAHPTQAGRPEGPTLSSVSGHREVYSGLGSVVFVEGNAGDEVVEVSHLKQIREPVDNFRIKHDKTQGFSSVTDEISISMPGVDMVLYNTVRDLMETYGGEMTATELADALGRGTKNLSRDLQPLKNIGALVPNGKRGDLAAYEWRDK